MEGVIAGVGARVKVGDGETQEEGRAGLGVLESTGAFIAHSVAQVAVGLASRIAVLGKGVSESLDDTISKSSREELNPGHFHIDLKSSLVSEDEAHEFRLKEFLVKRESLDVGLSGREVLGVMGKSLLSLINTNGDVNIIEDFRIEFVFEGECVVSVLAHVIEIKFSHEFLFILNKKKTVGLAIAIN